MQGRVLLASTEDGQKELRTAIGIRKAIKLEQLEESGLLPEAQAPLDFSRMTPEQYKRWVKEQEALLN